MKNIRTSQLKRAIFLDIDEFEGILTGLFGCSIHCEYGYDGISYGEDAEEEEKVRTELAKYFDVKLITSIHIDDCEYIGVWIIYQDEE